jgi:glycine dehydrogenase
VGIALDETVTAEDLDAIVGAFAAAIGCPAPKVGGASSERAIPQRLLRTSPYLTHPVFHAHRSETQMMRYLHSNGGTSVWTPR